MKKTILLLSLVTTLFAKAQTLSITINRNCNTYCAPGTWLLNTPFCGQYFLMTANGATSYTWTLSGNIAVTTPTLLFQVLIPGYFIYTITGSSLINNKLIYGTTTTTVHVQVCDLGNYIVGIPEYEPNKYEYEYFDFSMNKVEPTQNELLFYRRKDSNDKLRKVILQGL